MLGFFAYTKTFFKVLKTPNLSVRLKLVRNIWISSSLKHVTSKLFLTSQVYISETSNGMNTAQNTQESNSSSTFTNF